MALEDYALVTYTELKDALDIPSDSKKTRYENLINIASTLANRITKRILKSADYTDYLDGNGGSTIVLPQYPITNITELNLDAERNWNAATEVTEYGIYGETGVVTLFEDTFPDAKYSVKVVYTAGYVDVPEDIKSAVIEIVQFLYQRENSNLIGKKSVQTGEGISESWELSIPVLALETLLRYKK